MPSFGRKIQTKSYKNKEHLNNQLVHATMLIDKKRIRWLLKNGADPNKPNYRGIQPLGSAVEAGHTDIVKVLLNYEADPNKLDFRGNAPLGYAVQNVDMEIVRMLLNKGADPNKSDHLGNVPLVYAAPDGDKEIVELLLNKGADPNISARDGTLPLGSAIAKGYTDIVRVLLNYGADPNIPDSRGNVPLLYAVAEGLTDIVRLLLNKEADPNKPDSRGNPPLLFAAQNGAKEIVELLLNKGADLNKLNSDGNPPLVYAIIKGQGEIIKLLCNRGADKTAYFKMLRRGSDVAHGNVSKSFTDLYNYNLVPTPPCYTQFTRMFIQRRHPICWVMTVLNVIILSPKIRDIFTYNILKLADFTCTEADIQQCAISVSNSPKFIKPLVCLLQYGIIGVSENGNYRKDTRSDTDRISTIAKLGTAVIKNTLRKNPIKSLFSDRLAKEIGFVPVEVFKILRAYTGQHGYRVSRWFIGTLKQLVATAPQEYDIIMIQCDTHGATFKTAAVALSNYCLNGRCNRKSYHKPPNTLLQNKYSIQGAILWHPILAHFSTGFVCKEEYYMYDTIHPYHHVSHLNWFNKCVVDDCNVHIAIYTPVTSLTGRQNRETSN